MTDTLSTDMRDAGFLGISNSLTGRKWIRRPAPDRDIDAISRQQGVPDVLARVLAGREITPEDAASFLNPRLRDQFPDPSTFADMDLAASLIWEAVASGRKITVFADYDVDGATSAAQLVRWARAIGASFDVYVPDRVQEGYGPNKPAFDQLKASGTELVITVDCGAAATDVLEHARDIGLDVIVVDHHLMDDAVPPAAALVNPNRHDDTSGCGHLAAAGVTFVLLAALNREGRRRKAFEETIEPDLVALADLAALGTVCDVVPLTGFNRALVAQGLKVMSRWTHAGLRALAEVAGCLDDTASTYHAGFLLGPRINAGGRVGQAGLGARLLSTDDPEEAADIAAQLDGFNTERRQIEADVLDAALGQAGQQATRRGVCIASGDDWHPGVIGIVAGRLKDKVGKPSIVIGVDRSASPPVGKGSGRSVPGVNLGGAISAAREAGLLLAGGGHAMAGGLTVLADRITELTVFLDERLSEELENARDANALKLDGVLTPSGATIELAEALQGAGPFGQGNAEPRFVVSHVRISFAQRVGRDHVRFSLRDETGATLNGIAFRCADNPMGEALLAGNDQLWHAAGRLKCDAWRGQKRVQLQLEDLAAADQ